MKLKILALLVLANLPNILPAQNPAEGRQLDLYFLQTELPARHPDFFRKFTKKDWDTRLEALAKRAGAMSELEFALALQAEIARAEDPYTYLNLVPILQKQALIPIGLGWFDDGVYASASVRKFDQLFGCKVLKINGVDMAKAEHRVAQFLPKDNEIGYRNSVYQLFRFPAVLRVAGLPCPTDTLNLWLQKANGEQFAYQVFPIDFVNDRVGSGAVNPYRPNPDFRFKPNPPVWTSRLFPEDSLLVLQYNSCRSREMQMAVGDTARAMQLPAFQPFMDTILLYLERVPKTRLLFDLRFNGSGMAADGIQFARRVAALPTLNRKGKIFVATNSYTTGAATQVAVEFLQKTKATHIGEPTGDRPNHFSDMRTAELPNSGLRLSYPTSRLSNWPNGDPPTLEPEVKIPQNIYQFLEGRDPVEAWVRRMEH